MYEQVMKQNHTGIPDALKEKAEKKAGRSLSHVRIHRNSGLPELAGALAYTQGEDIYLGRGNERYLGHEIGHVVQQMRGAVKADSMVNGMPLNTDPVLEEEAEHFLD